ncbi:endonuclease domain-containing 1 protein-like [Sylvia atricapilla]|uniref:endonuclease domain-containing 1 protein-like n=1 Tax=Sylvia atricapilla TaxID=48155 RepID=UPI003397CFE7
MLGLLLLQVLSSCLWLGHSEVSLSFASCRQFFYAGAPPNRALDAPSSVKICQRYSNSYHFATLYDRRRRIPVYSAYIYYQGFGTRSKSWFVEPQLINSSFPKQMDTEESIRARYKIRPQIMGRNQALNQDYSHLQGLNRGHLSPSGHQRGQNSKTATFTLTNIVPQHAALNMGTWNNYEKTTMAHRTKNCTTTYVITGAVPGKSYISNNRVNVPSHIWSAACCVVGTRPKKAWGAIAENDKDKVEVLSLGDLEARLTQFYEGEKIMLFTNACPR